MKFNFVFPMCFEPWNWEDSISKGIGASETSVVEMGWRLARRGHDITIYTRLPVGSPNEWRGTKWHSLDDIDWDQPGVWILYRCPAEADRFMNDRTDQIVWMLAQDWDYEQDWNAARVGRIDRVIPLCHTHRQYLESRHSMLKGKCWVTQNGLKADQVERVEAEGVPQRNYKRIMYCSSPDRGLKSALLIYQRAKEYVPDLEFYATYGFNNIDKLIAQGATHFQKDKDDCLRLIDQTGAVMLGRIGQDRLYREYFKTAMWVYCTTFWETSHVAGAEGMAMGSIPIFSPIWAQGENTHWGSAVWGHPNDPMTISRFAGEVVRYATNPKLQDEIRAKMMPDVREKRDWEQFVHAKPGENWEQAAAEDTEKKRLQQIARGVQQQELSGYDGIRLPAGLCDNMDEAESRRRWLKLAKDHRMIDVGSADGAWSIEAARQGAKVLAIDVMASLTKLDQLAVQYGVDDNIDIVEGFVGSQNGLDVEISIGRQMRHVRTLTLDLLYLAEIAGQVGSFGGVDFIKIDVEGDELDVLRGAEGLIRYLRPDIMVEVHVETVPGKKVSVESVEKLIASYSDIYRFERRDLTYEGKAYCHLYATVKPETSSAAA